MSGLLDALTFGFNDASTTWSDSLTGKTAKAQFEKNYELQKEQLEYQKWYDQNNLALQIKQMRDAGLNPADANAQGTAVGGNSVSPTSTSHTAGIEDVVGSVGGIYGAIAQKAIAKDQLNQQAQIAAEKAEETTRHNKEIESILARNTNTREGLLSAEVEAKQAAAEASRANARSQNYETNYKEERGISSETSEVIKNVKEAEYAAKLMQAEKINSANEKRNAQIEKMAEHAKSVGISKYGLNKEQAEYFANLYKIECASNLRKKPSAIWFFGDTRKWARLAKSQNYGMQKGGR